MVRDYPQRLLGSSYSVSKDRVRLSKLRSSCQTLVHTIPYGRYHVRRITPPKSREALKARPSLARRVLSWIDQRPLMIPLYSCLIFPLP